jgi:protease-4
MQKFTEALKGTFAWERIGAGLVWIVLPLLIGVLIAAAIPQPEIGVIYLGGAIDPYSGRDLIKQIAYARTHPEIRAVVLSLNSPGGTVADTEAVYQELIKLRATKPVVTYVGAMAASGAYYLSVGTDYVFANPTSQVGNIGVIGYLPPSPVIFEGILSTGPYKLWGVPRDTYGRQIEMIKQGFYNAVILGRGERLKAGPEIILRGEIWPGTEALRLGLIDQLGSESDAIRKAESLARVANTATVDLAQLAGVSAGSYLFFAQTAAGADTPYPAEAGLYLLYIPPAPAQK